LRKGLCNDDEQAKCLDEFGEAGLTWACSQCPKKKQSDLDQYTLKLLHLLSLQNGGYPFKANDLTIDEWIDLGQVREALQPKTMSCPLMGRK